MMPYMGQSRWVEVGGPGPLENHKWRCFLIESGTGLLREAVIGPQLLLDGG